MVACYSNKFLSFYSVVCGKRINLIALTESFLLNGETNLFRTLKVSAHLSSMTVTIPEKIKKYYLYLTIDESRIDIFTGLTKQCSGHSFIWIILQLL